MKTTVISLGGSVIAPERPDTGFLKRFRKLILEQAKRGKRFIIICGGGRTCRAYRDAAKEICRPTPDELDWIGIHATKLNALLVKTVFGKHAHPRIIQNPTRKINTRKPVIIAGGWKPGFSTDYGAVMLAKAHGPGTILNLSNVDYVYDRDPNRERGARPFKNISWKEFLELTGKAWSPGLHKPFDPVASRKASQLRLKVIVMKGTDIRNLRECLNNKPFRGTVIGD